LAAHDSTDTPFVRNGETQLYPTPVHRMLTQLGCRAIVTTNFDLLLEQAWRPYSDEPIPPVLTWEDGARTLAYASGKPFLLKLHGCVQRASSICLTAKDCDRAGDSQAELLRTLMTANSVLWIGWGFGRDQRLTTTAIENNLRDVSAGFVVGCWQDDPPFHSSGVEITKFRLPRWDDMDLFVRRLAAGAGRRVAFEVSVLSGPEHTLDNWSLGSELARILSNATNSNVRYCFGHPAEHRAVLCFDSDNIALTQLRSLFAARDSGLCTALASYGVQTFDRDAAPWGSGAQRAPSMPVQSSILPFPDSADGHRQLRIRCTDPLWKRAA
jgi:hypothetical protein